MSGDHGLAVEPGLLPGDCSRPKFMDAIEAASSLPRIKPALMSRPCVSMTMLMQTNEAALPWRHEDLLGQISTGPG